MYECLQINNLKIVMTKKILYIRKKPKSISIFKSTCCRKKRYMIFDWDMNFTQSNLKVFSGIM